MAETAEALCGHLKALLSGVIPERELKPFIGKLKKLDVYTYTRVAEDISLIFTQALVGEFYIPPDQVSHLARRIVPGLNDSTTLDRVLWKDDALNSILALDPSLATTQEIWAGMTNLKSVLFRLDSKLSRKEKDKSFHSITHHPEHAIDAAGWKEFIHKFIPFLVKDLEIPETEYLPVSFIAASDKRMALLDKEGVIKSVSRNDDRTYDMNILMKSWTIRELAAANPSEFITRTHRGYPVEAEWEEEFPEPFEFDTPNAIISVSPKNGTKPRVVVVMNPVLSSLSYPLGRALKKINSHWSIQWVDSHDKARKNIQDMLSENVLLENPDVIRSFDQSSFTDNFSYREIQRPVLEELLELGWCTEYDIQVMDAICEGLVDLSSISRKGFVGRYGTGTPMGSFPSFPLASLCNGLLATFAYYTVKGKFPPIHTKRPFAWIVGDDCVIRDSSVADEYENICKKICLKINKSKSINSPRCVEFCSTFITPEGIWKKKKLPEFTNFGSLKEAISYYKGNFEIGFPKYREISPKIREMPEPFGLGPQVPIEREGDKFVPFLDIRDVVRGRLQIEELLKLTDDVANAREYMHGFNRAGIDADSRGIKKPLPKYRLLDSRDNHVSTTPPFLTFEVSLLRELNDLQQILSTEQTVSEKLQDTCERIDNIFQYFLEKYKRGFKRSRIVFKIAPDIQVNKPHHSELQKLLLQNDSFTHFNSEIISKGGNDYEF